MREPASPNDSMRGEGGSEAVLASPGVPSRTSVGFVTVGFVTERLRTKRGAGT